MTTAKAGDKTQVCRKLVLGLQKLYGKSVPKIDLPALETMLFGICLEDNSWANAEVGYKNLIDSYFDLNEVRVSSVAELETTLKPLRLADWKGLRIRSLLRFIFESTYSYDFEKLKRLTMDAAVKQLKKISDTTPFVRDFTLQQVLGGHVVAVDTSMLNAARWLGLVPVKTDINGAAESLKGAVRKSEMAEFCHLLRCVATDPRHIERLAEEPDDELSMHDVMDRLQELQSPPKRKPVKKVEPVVAAAKGKTTKSSAAKVAPPKAASGKSDGAASSKKSTAKKAAPATGKSAKADKKNTSQASSGKSAAGKSATQKSASKAGTKSTKSSTPTRKK